MSESGGAEVGGIQPAATAEEVAAIAAAIELTWPRADVEPEPQTPRWRWSGRWWAKPVPARRARP